MGTAVGQSFVQVDAERHLGSNVVVAVVDGVGVVNALTSCNASGADRCGGNQRERGEGDANSVAMDVVGVVVDVVVICVTW